jgi:hypothetical protein
MHFDTEPQESKGNTTFGNIPPELEPWACVLFLSKDHTCLGTAVGETPAEQLNVKAERGWSSEGAPCEIPLSLLLPREAAIVAHIKHLFQVSDGILEVIPSPKDKVDQHHTFDRGSHYSL